jgi:hypothetical protein
MTFANDPNRTDYERFDEYLVHSNWMSTVGEEYGVGAGTNLNAEIPSDAPTLVDEEDIPAILDSMIEQGVAPAPQPADVAPSIIYVLFFPATTTVVSGGVATCATATGSHLWTAVSADTDVFAVYAVVPTCPLEGAPAPEEFSAAHEIIEAATDPYFDAFAVPSTMLSGAAAGRGSEIADLCNSPVWDGTYTLPSIWSNAAAAAGQPPCQPMRSISNGMSADACVRSVSAGGSTSFTVTGWSTGPLASWNILSGPLPVAPYQTFNPIIQWASTTSNNGAATRLTIAVPRDAPSGSAFSLQLVPDHDQAASPVPFSVAVFVP